MIKNIVLSIPNFINNLPKSSYYGIFNDDSVPNGINRNAHLSTVRRRCLCLCYAKQKQGTESWMGSHHIAWGLAVCMGVLVAGPYTGAHLNPAVSIGLAVAGMFPWSSVPYYIVAQMIGGFLGGLLVWFFYKDHYDATDDEAAKLGTFCTAPAIRNYRMNFLSEVIATLVLVFIIISFSVDGNTGDAEHFKFGLAALGPIPVTLLIIALGMSLGGTTGYAMNPARDLSPRLAHAVCMKGDNDWAYSWIPVLGPIIGAIIAGFCGAALLLV